jgi:hypothetical protein
VRGGEATLRELVSEYRASGPAYRRTVQTTLKASYTGHYRAGMIGLLRVLEFRSTNTARQPVIRALELIARYARAGNLTYYPRGETAPEHRGTAGDWADLFYRDDNRGRRRTVRMAYEVATFQALREQLRCKEVWVVGAGRWRDPDEDLPKDFEARRPEHYASLRNPWTRPSSSTACGARWRPGSVPWTRRCPGCPGSTSPSGARARSGSPRWTPPRSRGTCARSRLRSAAGGPPSR